MKPPRSVVVGALLYVATLLALGSLPQGSEVGVSWSMAGLAVVAIAAAVIVWGRGR